MKSCVVTILFVACLQSVIGYNILGVFPYNGKSHFIVFREYLRTLAKRGHNVTVISLFPEKNPPQNYHDISLIDETKASVNNNWALEMSWKNHLAVAKTFIYNTNCDEMLTNKQVQNLIKEKQKFDVVVFEQFNTDCALGIAYKLNAPTIAVTSTQPIPWHYDRMGIIFVPSILSTTTNFATKTLVTLTYQLGKLFFNYFMKANDQQILNKHFSDIPSIDELAKNIKFYLINEHFVFSGSVNLPVNVIQVGGHHVAENKPLTGDLKKFFDEAKNGVVFVSFGSMIKSSTLSPEKREIMIEAFSEFPQRFVWKWDMQDMKLDKNKFYCDDWLPQLDILGHPKTVAFFTHAGLGSTTEGIHFGVPMLAMPITADQPANARELEKSGLGINLNYKDFNKENLIAALKTVLDPTFHKQVKEVSAAWHDRPLKAMDIAIFWTEYVARHPNTSIRNTLNNMPFYEFFLLDVLAVIAIVFLVPVLIIYFTCCKSRKSANTNKTKKIKRQ